MDPNQCSNTSCARQKAPNFIYCAECLNTVSNRIGDSLANGRPYYYFPSEQFSQDVPAYAGRHPIKG